VGQEVNAKDQSREEKNIYDLIPVRRETQKMVRGQTLQSKDRK
jgi:hypothetical protein